MTRVRSLLLSSVLLAAAAVVAAICVLTGAGQAADQAAMLAFERTGGLAIELARGLATNLTIVASCAAALASGLIALARRDLAGGLGAAVILTGSAITSQLLKNELIDRPALTTGTAWYANSLPSGHATLAVAAICAVLFVLPRRTRIVSAPVLAGLAAITAVGVVAAGWHRPSDVIVAALVVGAWCHAAAALVAGPSRRDARRTGALPAVAATLAAAALAVGYAVHAWGMTASIALISLVILATAMSVALMPASARRPVSAAARIPADPVLRGSAAPPLRSGG